MCIMIYDNWGKVHWVYIKLTTELTKNKTWKMECNKHIFKITSLTRERF